jgi:hypothetical protein
VATGEVIAMPKTAFAVASHAVRVPAGDAFSSVHAI